MLYLREPRIPGVSLRGGAIMAIIAALLLAPFIKRSTAVIAKDPPGLLVQMFFLGAGFMLVETKAVVHMALLFGGTWIVNSVVIFAVLMMILAANLFVAVVQPVRLAPYYAALLLSLIVSALVPMDTFLGNGTHRAGFRRVTARLYADLLCRRGLRGLLHSRHGSPTALSASTSRARCSAGSPNTAQWCSASSTCCSLRWRSTSCRSSAIRRS